jgi:hypothetical protein
MADFTADDLIEIDGHTGGSLTFRNEPVMFGGGLVTVGSDCTEDDISTPTLTFPTTPRFPSTRSSRTSIGGRTRPRTPTERRRGSSGGRSRSSPTS